MKKTQPVDNEAIALVGIGCCFPGNVNNSEQFWKFLCQGKDAITTIPKNRWSIKSYFHPIQSLTGLSYSRWGGFLSNIDQFEPECFGISPREAVMIDPQQRLLLECTWNALEDAGILPKQLMKSNTGVFVGVSTRDYAEIQADITDLTSLNSHSTTGSVLSLTANRISYCFDLLGPSFAVDTACSSSLLAVHLGCQSIWRNECEMSLVGGANIIISPSTFIGFSQMGMLSPDGRCKSFDAGANGFVRGEGAGIVVLTRLSKALEENYPIYALIKASGSNQDGHTTGITMPNGESQEKLLQETYQKTNISPSDINYIEAHGTGTYVGDPIEANALGKVLSKGRSKENPCWIGSVKTNIGHLEAGAGIAGLIKAALVLKHRQIPPNLHFNNPNPEIDFDGMKLSVPTTLTKFPNQNQLAIAGVNSFGFGGTNVHVVLSEFSKSLKKKNNQKISLSPCAFILPISARSKEALKKLVKSYEEYITSDNNKNISTPDLCYSTIFHRNHYDYRTVFVGNSKTELLQQIKNWNPNSIQKQTHKSHKLTIVYSGQGPQWWAMGRDLLKNEPIFRNIILQCDRVIQKLGGSSLLQEMMADEKNSRMDQTSISQPAIFALQVGLSKLYESWGIKPDLVIGHSVGEVAASYIAGAFTLEEATRIIFYRGKCMEIASSNGKMLAVGVNHEIAETWIQNFPDQISIAAINTANSVTLSGDRAALSEIEQQCKKHQIFAKFLHVNYAFHSPQMDPVKNKLLNVLADLKPKPLSIPMISTVTGDFIQGETLNANYWWRNVREPVLFQRGIHKATNNQTTIFLELSPHPVLSSLIKENSSNLPILSSLIRKKSDHVALMITLGQFYTSGYPINWKSVYSKVPGNFIPIPGYPWIKQSYWHEPDAIKNLRIEPNKHVWLKPIQRTADNIWTSRLDLNRFTYLKDHRVRSEIVFPAVGYIELMLATAKELFDGNNHQIENINFSKILFISENNSPPTVQLIHQRDSNELRIFSANQSTKDWTLHASGNLYSLKHSEQCLTTFDKEAFQKNSISRMKKETCYEKLKNLGLEYGPSFQGVSEIWQQEDKALGRIVVNQTVEHDLENYLFHPTLLDACLQTLHGTKPYEVDNENNSLFLPSHIQRIQYFNKPGREIWSYAILRRRTEKTLEGDVYLYNHNNELLLVVQGLICLKAGILQGQEKIDLNNMLYLETWKSQPLSTTKIDSIVQERYFVISNHSNFSKRLIDYLKSKKCLSNCKSLIDFLNTKKTNRNIIYLPSNGDCLQLVDIVQTLLKLPESLPQLFVVNQNTVEMAPLNGMIRVIQNENPNLYCKHIKINYHNSIETLWKEIKQSDHEEEVLIQNKKRWVPRINRTQFSKLYQDKIINPITDNFPFYLKISNSGMIDGLILEESERISLGPDQIEIKVHAAGLNFRDVLKTLELYPMDGDDYLQLGDECAGIVSSIGKNVNTVNVGDEVMGIAQGCFGAYAYTKASFVLKKPNNITFEEAATLPIAFLTAYYCLCYIGQLKQNEKVLIHAAAGGVGLAAVQIAQHLGAEIFATASQPKQKFLSSLGIHHIMDSRSTLFADQIMKTTNEKGIDLVLNSLSGEAIPKGISVLKAYGKFIEIGKRDIYENKKIGLHQLRNNLSFHVVDLSSLLIEKPELVKSLLEELSNLFNKNIFKPLPLQTFPISNAKKAFRKMSQGKHIGKIILSQPNKKIKIRPKVQSTINCSPNKSYLITGGLGGVGLMLAQWLINRGAKHLVLVSRHGITTGLQQNTIQQFKNHGVQILTPKADITDNTAVKLLFLNLKKESPPLAGIFHLAAVIDDAPLLKQNAEQFKRVTGPKILGAWNLHRQTIHLKLDYFVLFSSISSQFGSPGQANYAAANAFLDSFINYRRKLNLPCITINWGHILEVGHAARHDSIKSYLIKMGDEGITPKQAMSALGYLLQHKNLQVSVMNMNWQIFLQKHEHHILLKRFSKRTTLETSNKFSSENKGATREMILNQPRELRLETLQTYLQEQVAKVLELKTNSISFDKKINEMGLDSLMAIELKNTIERDLAVSLPITQMIEGPTLIMLTYILSRQLGCETNLIASQLNTKHDNHCLITLNSGKITPPLFCIHPVDGRISIYEPMIKVIKAGFSIYGITSPLLINKMKQYNSLDELSNDYVAPIIQQQPEGPYALFGFSVGGVIALNIAKQLEALGKQVIFVGLADPILVETSSNNKNQLLEIYLKLLFNSLQDLIQHINPSFQSNIKQLSQKIVAANSREEQRRLTMECLFNDKFFSGKEDIEKIERYVELVQIHIELLLTDEAKPIQAPVTVWRPSQPLMENTAQEQLLTARCLGELQLIVLEGDHFSIMKPPAVQKIASALSNLQKNQIVTL